MEKSNKKQLLIKLSILATIIIAIFLVFRLTSLNLSNFTPTKIKDFILQFGIISPLIFVLLYALRGVVLVIPVGIMSLAGGLAFGKWWGTLLILLGATFGAGLSFLVARYLGRDFIERFDWLHKGRIKKFDDSIGENGFKIILFMRLIPLFQYDALNFGAGLSKVKFRHYAPATFIGMIPGGFINATLGDSLDNILSVQFFVALGLFILLMFVPTVYKKIKKRKGEKIPQENNSVNESGQEAVL